MWFSSQWWAVLVSWGVDFFPGNQTLSNPPCWGMLQPEWVVRTFGLIPRLTQIVKCAQTSNPNETVRRFEICRSLDRKGQLLVENLGLQNEMKCGIVGAIKNGSTHLEKVWMFKPTNAQGFYSCTWDNSDTKPLSLLYLEYFQHTSTRAKTWSFYKKSFNNNLYKTTTRAHDFM